MTIKPLVQTNMLPYAYGSGNRWHPAIKRDSGVWYWPNITKATEDEAANEAKLAIMDAQLAAQAVISGWNIFPAE